MKISIVFIGLLVLIAACDKSTKKTPDGLEFKILKQGDGTMPESGQLVVYNFKMIDSKDSVWFDTYDRGLPEVTAIGDSSQQASEDNFFQMLRMLSRGDSAYFTTSVREFFTDFAKSEVPPGVDSTRDMTYRLTIVDIMDREDFAAFRDEAIKKYEATLAVKKVQQMGKDTVEIDQYLARQGITAKTTPSGLRYVITKNGNGSNVNSGQTAKIEYAGYLLNGTYFDTSIKSVAQEKGVYDPRREPYEPIEITVDESSVITGWHEAIKLLNKGAKATFYIPSPLAYGPQGRGDVIGENTILVFDLEVVDVN